MYSESCNESSQKTSIKPSYDLKLDFITKLNWPGDSEETLQSSSQAAICSVLSTTMYDVLQLIVTL